MNCTNPIIAFETGKKTKTGKAAYYLDLNRNAEKTKTGYRLFIGQKKINAVYLPPYVSYQDGNYWLTKAVETPCGKCLGCQLDKAKEWATRIYLESKNHLIYYFTTLTYNEKHYHKNRNYKRDLQLFLKRLRKTTNQKIRYFAQFEHGEKTKRGHYHIILFFDEEPKDNYRFVKKNANNIYYSSELIQKSWQLGNDITVISKEPTEAINYVSRYCVKKTGEDGFHLQSRNPGIGENGITDLEDKNYILVHMKKQTQKRGIPKYLKTKLSDEKQKELKEKSRRWILSNYSKPIPENEKEITGKEELNAEKTRNLLAKNKTKIRRKI